MKEILQWRLRPGGNYATSLSSDHNWTDHCGKKMDRLTCKRCRRPRRAMKDLIGDTLFEYRIRR
jgi:hypothetical protein